MAEMIKFTSDRWSIIGNLKRKGIAEDVSGASAISYCLADPRTNLVVIAEATTLSTDPGAVWIAGKIAFVFAATDTNITPGKYIIQAKVVYSDGRAESTFYAPVTVKKGFLT